MKGLAIQNAAAEGCLVGVVQLVVLCYAACDGRDGDIVAVGQFAEDVKVGGVAFHRRTQRQDDFLHVAALNAVHQRCNLQILWADAVHG